MHFEQTKLSGVFKISLERNNDSRGSFARTFCVNEFNQNELSTDIKQCNISYNKKKDTLRGMHYQSKPYEEIKLVRCIKGSICDVVIDLREESDTYMEWLSLDLTSQNGIALYIPKGFAHGFQTLEDDSEVLYQMSEIFYPESAKGIHWKDPLFNIDWPSMEPIISEKDSSYSKYTP